MELKEGSTRIEAIDVLRGIAIFGMVLSGSIAFGGLLPAWMYHAQVPPPLHQFNPAIPGITWVDLVFPLFLFCMGAAISFSVSKKVANGVAKIQIGGDAFKRFLQLLFFALFFHHCKAWVISATPSFNDQLISVGGFVLLFGQLTDFKNRFSTTITWLIKFISYFLGIILLVALPFKDGTGFNFYQSDIIIVVLANMALFATLIVLFTIDRPLLRGFVLVLLTAVILASREEGESSVKQFFNFKEVAGFSFDWAYKFYFLKYLFIVLPGSWAGEWLLQYKATSPKKSKVSSVVAFMLPVSLLIVLLALLFSRVSDRYSFLVLLFLGGISWIRFRSRLDQSVQQRLAFAGTYFLLVGLLLEPYEGGIKKDPSTFSYYFVTVGYGFWSLLILLDAQQSKWAAFFNKFLGALGRNPLVAYATGSLLILPLLSLFSLRISWDAWAHTSWQGFLKGIIFTLLVSGVTILFNRCRFFWRT